MSYTALVTILFFLIYAATCRPDDDPNTDVEYISKSSQDLKKQMEKTLDFIVGETTKLKKQLDAAKNTMADKPGSDTRIKSLLTMHDRIMNLTSTLEAARQELKDQNIL